MLYLHFQFELLSWLLFVTFEEIDFPNFHSLEGEKVRNRRDRMVWIPSNKSH